VTRATDRVSRDALTRWFLGLLVGGVAGIAPLALGTLGLVLAVPVVLWALVDRPRGVALGGAMVGTGAVWLVVLGRIIQSCAGPNTATEGCVGPDLSGLILLPIMMLAMGGLVSFATALRLPSRRTPPTDGPSSPSKDG